MQFLLIFLFLFLSRFSIDQSAFCTPVTRGDCVSWNETQNGPALFDKIFPAEETSSPPQEECHLFELLAEHSAEALGGDCELATAGAAAFDGAEKASL